MIEHIIFSITLVITILNGIVFVGYIFGRNIRLPLKDTPLSLSMFVWSYPSYAYQAWFWSGLYLFN